MPEDRPAPPAPLSGQEIQALPGRAGQTPAGHAPQAYNAWEIFAVWMLVAGVVYPVIAGALLGAIMGCTWLIQEGAPSASDLGRALQGLSLLGMAAAMGGVACAFVAFLVSIPVFMISWLGLRLLGLRVGWHGFGAFCGGLTGFACMFPLGYHECVSILEYPDRYWDEFWMYLLATLVGPMLAIFCGQVAGARAVLLADLELAIADGASSSAESRRWSFSIQQLLGLMAVISVLLSALRLLGLFTSATLLLVACWLVWQTYSRYPATWVSRRIRIGPRRANPRGHWS